MFYKKQQRILLPVITAGICCLMACTKTDVRFGNIDQSGDPAIAYYDQYPVSISTYQIDSFVTSGHAVLSIGHNDDPDFGAITAGTYADLNLPEINAVKDLNVVFDSLELILTPTGNYYGDTSAPFSFQVKQLQEVISNEEEAENTFYNSRHFATSPTLLAQKTTHIYPASGKAVHIRLADAMGITLLNKLQTNADEIQAQENFTRYFKGLYIGSDSVISKALCYFSLSDSSSVMRLHYKINNPTFEEAYLDFTLNSGKQFNQLFYHHTGTNLAVFSPYKKQVKQSAETGNLAYLHSNMASYIKIDFPSLLSLKELHPYIKIIRADLVIKPLQGSYNNPYQLPSALNLYVTDDNNNLLSVIANQAHDAAQTGNLYIDQLYGNETAYTFDIAEFLSDVLSEGTFASSSLMLSMSAGVSDSQTERLVVPDQTSANGIQLKLYVLGL